MDTSYYKKPTATVGYKWQQKTPDGYEWLQKNQLLDTSDYKKTTVGYEWQQKHLMDTSDNKKRLMDTSDFLKLLMGTSDTKTL